ncbi:hypothetical protein, partial [Enterobacter hormaechei]
AVTLAILSYFLVEKPLRSSRRMAGWPRGRVVTAALAATLAAALCGQLMIAAHNRITLSATRDRFAWYAEPGRPLPLDLTGCAPIDGE